MEEPLGVDDLVVTGYRACACGAWVADPGDRMSIAVCPECRGKLGSRAQDARFSYEAHGRTFEVKPRKAKPRKRPPRRKMTSEARQKAQRRERARQRAYTRLAAIDRPMYELLLAEEYVREGLDPTIRSARPRPHVISNEVFRQMAEYEERCARERTSEPEVG